MSKRLQVLLDEEEYSEFQAIAQRQRISMAEWVRLALRAARDNQNKTVESKLDAIAAAYRHQFPTADIEVMLQQIEKGRACFT